MEVLLRRAKIEDAKSLHDFEIDLQKEMAQLFKGSELNQFAELELRDETEYTTENYIKWLTDSEGLEDKKLNNIFYVIEFDSKVIASINLEVKESKGMQLKKRGYISTIYIEKDFRGKGYSNQLMEKALQWFNSKNTDCISVDVSNEWARKLYEKFGFIITNYCMIKEKS